MCGSCYRQCSGLPSAACFKNIINDIFQNEQHTVNCVKSVFLFSKCNLTPSQVSQLSYADGFTPCNFYMVYQYQQGTNTPVLQLISFIRKGKYTYGAYFDIANQTAFSYSDLVCSYCPVVLSDNVTFTSSNYLEVYLDIDGCTTILGNGTNEASLQYSKNCKYFYASMTSDGLDETIPTTYLTGLSKNLSCNSFCNSSYN